MSLLQVNFYSDRLKRTVPMTVVLPVDGKPYGGELPPEKPFSTLYLLHGLFGNCTDWVTGTRIQRWAQEKQLAVVMPSGDNSFYVDLPRVNNEYGEFIGRELVDVTRRMFPLSRRREDTFIAGLSMGGFGALRNGLKYHDTFSAIIALSSAVHLFELPLDSDGRTLIKEDDVFGDMRAALMSDKNPAWLLEQLKGKTENGQDVKYPRVYMACGTEDGLIEPNRSFRDKLLLSGVELTYEEGPGGHTWDFWDEHIHRALEWLAL